jgi:GrpB-like predicted nucleotidyltransferase (UPF0157 family)
MIQVVDHDPAWSGQFARERQRIADAVGSIAVRIHHIGSTAIPKMKAKPVIDILVEVPSLDVLDEKSSALEALGYEALGEFGIPGRRYFCRGDAAGLRTHQVHAFKAGSPDVIRHLAFRDYLRANRPVALEYGKLKERLASLHPHDRDAYMNGKDAFVKEHEKRALAWMGAANFKPLSAE